MDTEEPPLTPNPELLSRQPKWFKPVFYGCIVASALFVLAVLFSPYVLRSRRAGPDIYASSNARQIGLALFEFEMEYGAFPNASTIPLVEKEHGTSINLSGVSSNSQFRQLFAAQLTYSEMIFFAKIKNCRIPDANITLGKILEPKSCAFSYISGLSSKDDPLTPLVLTPLIPGTSKFDPKPFDGKAIILHIDNSVRTYDIHKDGHVFDKGIDLLSAKHPVWKGKAPDIRYPDL